MYTCIHRKSAIVLYYRVLVMYICVLLVQFVGAFTYTSQLLDGGEGGGEVDVSIYIYIYDVIHRLIQSPYRAPIERWRTGRGRG